MMRPQRAPLRLTGTTPRWSMTTSPHLSGKLREALGTDAGDELIGIVDKAAADITDLRGDVAELRHEMQVGFARIEHALAAMRSDIKADLAQQIAAVRTDLGNEISAVRTDLGDRIGGVRSDLMKWSFTFWVGAVLSIAALAGVLRWQG